MLELKVDKFENGKVTFYIERQDEEDYERLNDENVTFKLSDGFIYRLESCGFISFYPELHTFCVRGAFKDRDFERIEVAFSEYLIIYELVNKYNEEFLDFWICHIWYK